MATKAFCLPDWLDHCRCYTAGYACCHCDSVPLTPTPQKVSGKQVGAFALIVGAVVAALVLL